MAAYFSLTAEEHRTDQRRGEERKIPRDDIHEISAATTNIYECGSVSPS